MSASTSVPPIVGWRPPVPRSYGLRRPPPPATTVLRFGLGLRPIPALRPPIHSGKSNKSMRKPGGYGIIFGPLGTHKEWDTFTCAHCNVVVPVKPKCDPADLGGQCRLCDKPVCPKC